MARTESLKKSVNLTNGPAELALNLEGFPGFSFGDLIEISPVDRTQQSGDHCFTGLRNFPLLSKQVDEVPSKSDPHSVPEKERLILKIPINSPSSNLRSDAVYIESNIAKSFGLISRSLVNVTKANPERYTLDSLELMFRHQYLARSVMWRMKSYLVGESVYTNKLIEFAGIHCNVLEMWRAGEKTQSGLIGPDTKIVFRSASSQIFIFLQMSSEMWDFDINGDLYFEKAVNGFLADLFQKWNQVKCIHDVTIVLFSRTFYKADDIVQFPLRMRGSLQRDWRGRFYEDFYRVVVQNERYESWTPILSLLMQLFNQYEREVVRFHETDASGLDQGSNLRVPKAVNSTASQGNFLEVLNISLNVFDKHNVDRSFDRTGQLSIVISPGVGVFEVEFDLTNLTKQRIIDNGIGSDLVCLGEQPLHAVPLFKYHCKDTSSSYSLDAADVYNMPHWINLSFYTTPVPPGPSSFIPRIKLPKTGIKGQSADGHNGVSKCPLKSLYARSQSRDQVAGKSALNNGFMHSIAINGTSNGCNNLPLNVSNCNNSKTPSNVITPLDYDDYDDQIFKPTAAGKLSTSPGINGLPSQRRKSVVNDRHSHNASSSDRLSHFDRRPSENPVSPDGDQLSEPIEYRCNRANSSSAMLVPSGPRPRASSPVLVSSSVRGNSNSIIPSPLTDCTLSSSCNFGFGSYPPSRHALPKFHAFDDLTLVSHSPRVNRSGHRPKALINPFDPSQITIKLTSNRRRWTHVFPLDASGIFMQQHHYKAVPAGHLSGNTPSTPGNNDHHNETIMVPVTSTPTQMRKSSTSMSNKNANQVRNGTSTDDLVLTKNTRPSPRNSTSTDDKNFTNHRSSIRVIETRSDTMTYAWGATGELEWTPAITTTMDWKSLVMPACLPITTDFFPDAMSLQNDYYTAQYNLLPVDQGSELMKFVCYRGGDDLRNHKPINVQQVLEELTCQRLQQGFQLIMLPRNIKDFGVLSDNNLGKTEYTMSIGNIFHRLHIAKDTSAATIIVTQFKPKHPYPSIPIHYPYRFRAPDNQTFGVSWVDFTPERLENYKWNHLDNYICMRGEGDNELEESLKFWRFRLLLLPNICQSITARITECDDTGQQQLRCLGAYKETNHDDRMLLFTGFMNFFAMISKINVLPFKKAAPAAAVTQRTANPTSPMPKAITSKRHSLPSPNSSGRSTGAPKSPKNRDGSNMLELDQMELKGPSPNLSPKIEKHLDLEKEKPCKAKKIPLPTLEEIAGKLKECPFILENQKGLLPYSFISASAILWTIETFASIDSEVEAMSLLRSMHHKKLICHASGDECVPFICGFFLYHVVCPEAKHSSVDIRMFQKDWMECEMCLKEVTNNEEEATVHTRHDWNTEFSFNQAILDLSPSTPRNERHERVEWVHLRYHSRYDPGQAFGIDLDWLVATGHQIADIVSSWTHKAATYKLHLVPIPNDPFALPFSGTSDPLRGPIFIDLNLASLPDDLKDENVIIQFREKILFKWGFLPYLEPRKNHLQYVHVSGSIFVMIPRKSDRDSVPPPKNDSEITSHENYISKHFSKVKPGDTDAKQTSLFQSGFLWSWNYMITKRWKSKATGDEVFMKRVMEDFKQFCSNSKNRLHEFYLEQFKGKNLSTSTDSSHSSLSDLSVPK